MGITISTAQIKTTNGDNNEDIIKHPDIYVIASAGRFVCP